MRRRTLLARLAGLLAAVGAGIGVQAQRVAQPALTAAQYVVSPGQRAFTLVRLDGTQVRPDQVLQVFYKAPSYDMMRELGRELFTFEGWSLRLTDGVGPYLERLMVIHQ